MSLIDFVLCGVNSALFLSYKINSKFQETKSKGKEALLSLYNELYVVLHILNIIQ